MIERGCRSCFTQKSLAVGFAQCQIVRKEFQRNKSFQLQVLRFIDNAHATGAELVGNPVMRNDLANHGAGKPILGAHSVQVNAACARYTATVRRRGTIHRVPSFSNHPRALRGRRREQLKVTNLRSPGCPGCRIRTWVPESYFAGWAGRRVRDEFLCCTPNSYPQRAAPNDMLPRCYLSKYIILGILFATRNRCPHRETQLSGCVFVPWQLKKGEK